MEGGRGTGKSLAIRMDAHMRAMQFPGFKYLVLRRTMPELRKSHFGFIEVEMKKLGGFYHKTDNIAHYDNGSRGYFGHCETDADILNYLSAQFDAIYFDELSTFTLNMFLQISSSARSPEDAPYIAIVRGGTNPIGEGSGWVKSWFIDKNVNFTEYPDYNPNDFHTIHSVYTDNPHLNREQYRKQLANLPKHIRDAWLDGLWIDPDGYFADFLPRLRREDTDEVIPWHVIDELPTVKGQSLLEQRWIAIYRVMDWGYAPDPAVCLWIAVLPNGQAIVFKEMQWTKTTAAKVAEEIVSESYGMKIHATYCDPTMFVSSKATEGLSIGDIIENNGVDLTPSINDREAAGETIHEWLNTIIEEQPKLQILRSGAPNLIRTFPDMKTDKSNPRRIADGEDHWVISLGYFTQSDITAAQAPTKSRIPRWMRPAQSATKVLGSANVQR